MLDHELVDMDTYSILIAGAAGQGLKKLSLLLVKVLYSAGYNVFTVEEYMSRVRGGENHLFVVFSRDRVQSPRQKADIYVPLKAGISPEAYTHISGDTLIIGDADYILEYEGQGSKYIPIELNELSHKYGSVYKNTIIGGVICGYLGLNLKVANEQIESIFSKKGNDIVEKNRVAFAEGYEIGMRNRPDKTLLMSERKSIDASYIMSGTWAVALGALTGGVNIVSFYPMSPSTGVAEAIATYSSELGVVVEQAEDEIAAIDMAIGAWFGGARALVTTSGGGFALMGESISLSGMAEIPLVIHLGQRPGPATGLPTRTMQGDLLHSRYIGHGEFPRILLSPGNIEEACSLTAEAFNLADMYQVPVIILTDQYLLDSTYNVSAEVIDSIIESFKVNKKILRNNSTYKRYSLEYPISPRSVPGYGDGVVMCNGNEHNEYGDVTEEVEVVKKMQDKRMAKLDIIKENAPVPYIVNGDAKYMLISWGSTYNVITEALKEFDNVGYMHFKWLYPFPDGVVKLLEGKNIIVAELNSTGQFSHLLKSETGITANHKILKYDGRPFYIEEMIEAIRGIVE